MSLLDAFDAVPTRCELGDHSLCEHAGDAPDMPIMTWDVDAKCARGDHSWCPDNHQPASTAPVTLRTAWGGFQEL